MYFEFRVNWTLYTRRWIDNWWIGAYMDVKLMNVFSNNLFKRVKYTTRILFSLEFSARDVDKRRIELCILILLSRVQSFPSE